MNRGPTLISASVMLHNLQDALRDHANRPDWLEAQAKAVRGLLADLDASTLTLEELPLYRDALLALTVIEVAVRQGGIKTARFTADTAANLVDGLLEATPRGGQLWEVRGGPADWNERLPERREPYELGRRTVADVQMDVSKPYHHQIDAMADEERAALREEGERGQ